MTYTPEGAPPPMYSPVPVHGIDVLLREVIENDGSDLHLNEDDVPRIRTHGELTPFSDRFPLMRRDALHRMLHDAVGEMGWKTFQSTAELDTSYAYEDIARFRVNLSMQRGRVSATLRTIPKDIRALDELGMPEVLGKFSMQPRGLVLVTGPTGSGKSTTLASMLDLANRNRAVRIITIEDPIEFEHANKRALITQREVGRDTASFTEALKRALRQDPDIILVGELRDYETMSIALNAADTGHLVFATLHTSSAAETISRIINFFPGDQQPQIRETLANSLNAVVCQTLVPTLGNRGRVAVAEIMVATDAIRSLIRENKTAQIPSSIQASRDIGGQTRDFHLAQLVRAGTISMPTARAAAGDIEELNRLMEDSGVRSMPSTSFARI